MAVVGYRCDEFPAFYARSSGFKLDHRCDGLHDLARMIRLQREIGPGGLLIANPIPEDHALEAATIEERIAEAVAEARAQGRRQEGGDAVSCSARIVELTERPQPRGQHRADQEQRHSRGAGGGGAVRKAVSRRPSSARASSSSATS